MKRTVTLFLTVVMICSLITGCKAKQQEQTTPETETTVVVETTEAVTVPAETADPELEANFVEIVPEETQKDTTSADASGEQKQTGSASKNETEKETEAPEAEDTRKDDVKVPENTATTATEPNNGTAEDAHISNMGDLIA